MDNYTVEPDIEPPLESHAPPPQEDFKPDVAMDAALDRAEIDTGATGTLEKVRKSIPRAKMLLAGAAGVIALAIAGGVTWFMLPKKPKLLA